MEAGHLMALHEVQEMSLEEVRGEANGSDFPHYDLTQCTTKKRLKSKGNLQTVTQACSAEDAAEALGKDCKKRLLLALGTWECHVPYVSFMPYSAMRFCSCQFLGIRVKSSISPIPLLGTAQRICPSQESLPTLCPT